MLTTPRLRRLVSRLLPAALDRYPRGLTGHVAHPSRSIQQLRGVGLRRALPRNHLSITPEFSSFALGCITN
jgi:hypothetical protein